MQQLRRRRNSHRVAPADGPGEAGNVAGPSGAPATSGAGDTTGRHQILYAEQFWRKQRLAPFFLLAMGLIMGPWTLSQTRRLDFSNLVWLAYVPAGLLVLGLLWYYRRRHHVEVAPDGLRIHKMRGSVTIDYDSIRSVRVQPLRAHFQDNRARMGRQPITKALLDEPAVFVRLAGEDGETSQVGRKLGPRLHHQGVAAFPVADAEGLARQVSAHLPRGQGSANLGGAKRRKRRR